MERFGGHDWEFLRADRTIDGVVGKFHSYDWAPGGTLSHYTNDDGFRGILRERRFRATSAAQMGTKDKQEMQHAEDLIEEGFVEVARQSPDAIRRVREGRKRHSVIHQDCVGIICFTRERNSERHWREHGRCEHGTAYCIDFRMLTEKIAVPNIGFSPMRVEYDRDVLRERIRSTALEIMNVPGRDQKIEDARVVGVARIADIAAVSYKEPEAFSWEKEHRMVLLVRSDAPDIWKRPPGRRPYLEIPVRANDQNPALASVLVRGSQHDLERTRCFLENELRYGATDGACGGRPPMPVIELA